MTSDLAVVNEGQETPAQRAGVSALPAVGANPAALIMYAMDKGADVEKLEQLFALQQKWEANEARKAYVAAMARFKKNPPTIIKDKHVSFKTEKGVTAYDHATIGEVCEKIVGALAEHGFSHRWIPKRGEGGMMTITCVITHELGHSEETSLEAGLDTSGGKNNIQAMVSTTTYLQRHSLIAATGLAPKSLPDDDGHGAGEKLEDDKPTRSEEVVAKVKAVRLDEVLMDIAAATSPAAMEEAKAKAAKLTNVAEKQIASQAYAKRLAALRKAAKEPAEPATFAQLEERMRAAPDEAARALVLQASQHLPADQHKGLEALWLELREKATS